MASIGRPRGVAREVRRAERKDGRKKPWWRQGTRLVHRDGRQYRVQRDGSWRRIRD